MQRVRSVIRDRVLRGARHDVSLERLRHNDRPVYVAEGYGGRPIECFPPCRFFRLHEDGRPEEASAAFCDWYRVQFRKYAGVPKRLGGMQNGTLHRLLAEVCREAGVLLPSDPAAVDGSLLERAIALRVAQRFELLQAIRRDGYLPTRAKAVLAWRRGEDVVLTGGHHRAAALQVLDREALPAVSVFPAQAFRSLKRLGII
jgi:hypothetical protein